MRKRTFDIAFSLFALIVSLPFFCVIAILIILTSKGPVFYLSRRVGKDGKIIKCWKFRTMRLNAEHELQSLLKENPHLKKEWQTFFKLKNDPRVTSIGKILRKTSLDELPQFWNVLKGDLSVVGPRPFLIEEIEKYVGHRKKKILSIRPGITGIWQTSGRNLLTFEERLLLEEKYVDQQSFFLDLFLIVKTLKTVFLPKGAF